MRGAVPIVLLLLMASATFSAGQDSGQVTVLRAGDRELERAAFRLRVCPGDLLNLREVLYEASLAAPEAGLRGGMSELAQFYLRVDPTRAENALEAVLLRLHQRAEAATSLPEFQTLTGSGFQIIATLAELNPTLAERFEEDWPDAPEDVAGGVISGTRSSAAHLRLIRQAMNDPHQALSQLPELEGGRVDFSARSTILAGLAQEGAYDAAVDLLDDTMAAFNSMLHGDLDERSLSPLLQFLTAASRVDFERLNEVVAALESAVQILRHNGGQQTHRVHIGSELLQLTSSEHFVFSAIQELRQQYPETTLRLLDAEPSLKAKLESLGGIDRVLNPGRRDLQVQAGLSRARRLTTALHRQEVLTPEYLLHAATVEGLGASELVHHVESSCFRGSRTRLVFSESIEAIAEAASWMSLEMEDPTASASHFARLVSSLARCQGEVASGILDRGFQLLDQLRQDGAADDSSPAATDGRRRGVHTTDALEAALLSAFAVTDFPAGMARIRAVEDPVIRYRALMSIVQTYLYR